MTRIDRRALFASGAAAALLAATGVSAMPKRGGVLRAALSGAARDQVWGPNGGLMIQAARSAVLEGLTEIAADGTLRGVLAERWDSREDGRIWTFQLRSRTAFHDGSLLDSLDVAAVLAALGEVHCDRNSVRLDLNQPNPNLPYHLAGPDYLISAPGSPHIGTGPYVLERFEPGRRFIGSRIDKHWRDGQAGWFDRVEFSHFDDMEVRAQALVEGLVDVADVPELPDMTDMQAIPEAGPTLQIARNTLQIPRTVGRIWPLDNLRMAERWWAS